MRTASKFNRKGLAFGCRQSQIMGGELFMRGIMKIVFASLLLAGVSVVTSGQDAIPGETESAKPPFTLTISLNQANPNLEATAAQAVKVGSWVAFRIRKTNISDEEIAVRPQGRPLQYDVRDSSGNPVARRKSKDMQGSVHGVQPAGLPEMVQPGESKIIFEAVSSWYEMDRPGTYVIQVSECISDDPASDAVKSNRITVTVLPADEPPANQ
jgi:hypothetical protein